jgi:hypothetical protein
MKAKTHMTISIDAEKVVAEIHYLFNIKTVNKLAIRKIIPQHNKGCI